jgi:hypothetical protein
MRHAIAAVTVALLASPADAADFRVLDFGSPCDSIRELEGAQGSIPIPWTHSEAEGWYGFRGRAFGREVSILYLCVNGHLCTGNYLFPFEEPDQAVESYRGVYEDLVSRYGKPFVDNTPWQHGVPEKDQRFIASDPRRYMTSWRTSGVRTTLSLMPNSDSSGPALQVFVVVSRIRTDAGSNNALEQTRDE